MPTSFNIFTYFLEDDQEDRALIEDVLNKTDLKPICKFYDNPTTFLNEVDDKPIIGVIDYYLPDGITGVDMVRELKKKNNFSYLIAMSGQRKMDVVVDFVNAGISKYIKKDNSSDYLNELEDELMNGLKEVKRRIEVGKMEQLLTLEVQKRQKKLDELLQLL